MFINNSVLILRIDVKGGRSFDSEIKRAADGGTYIDCCYNYWAIGVQSQMKLFQTTVHLCPII